jgi:hypothetical protein
MSATGSVNLIVLLLLIARLLRFNEEPAAIFVSQAAGTAALLPGRFRNARYLSTQSQPTETQAAQPELAQVGARPSANLAAVVLARGKLRPGPLPPCVVEFLLDLCVLNSFCGGHFAFSS